MMKITKSIYLPVVVVSFSLLFTGCKQITQKAQEVAEQTQLALLTEAELAKISDPLVRKHLVAQANLKSYRVVSRSSGRGEPISTTEVQINGTEVKFRTLTEVGGKANQEMIVIGDTTYIKDFSDSKWWMQTGKPEVSKEESSDFERPDTSEIKAEVLKKETSEFKNLGTEACGSLTCYKYQEIESENKEAVRTFWFDNKEYLLRKEENKFGEFTSTNEYSYTSINISVPSPTKEVPKGKSIYEMMIPGATSGSGESGSGTLPTEADLDKLMEQYGQESGDN